MLWSILRNLSTFTQWDQLQKWKLRFTQNSSFPRDFPKKKWIISEVVHTNTTIFTSSRKLGTNDLNIFFGTDLRGGFPEQMAFKTEKIDLDREASSKKCVQT